MSKNIYKIILMERNKFFISLTCFVSLYYKKRVKNK